MGIASDHVAKHRKKANKALQPEDCLWPLVPAAFLIPIGLFWYGWSLQAHSFCLIPLLGTAVFGMGVIATFMPVQMYLVSAFTVHSASALAAGNVLRSIVGAVLPLAGQGMYAALGSGWGNSLLAFIALVLTLVPFLLIHYGKRLRK